MIKPVSSGSLRIEVFKGQMCSPSLESKYVQQELVGEKCSLK